MGNRLMWVFAGVFVCIVFVWLVLAVAGDGSASGNVAHIKIRGVITSEKESVFGSSTASAQDIAEHIRKADSNPAIKAILLDINSPGGSAVASEELAMVVKSAEKPVVALIREMGTSGAYWTASSSDFIVASPLSITGGVGATSSYLEFSGLFEKYGIGYRRIVSGELKDAGTPFKNLTLQEEKILQEIIGMVGEYFAKSVQENRNLSSREIESIRSGRIYTGRQALGIKLVDQLGSMDVAKQAIIKLGGVEEVKLAKYETKEPFSLTSILSQNSAIIGRNIGASLLPENRGFSLT